MQCSELFPDSVVVVSATAQMWHTPVLQEEEALINKATDKRQGEFRAGRHCAHTALAALGLPLRPILRDERRAPIWPSGYLGSITHCHDYCLAACCKAGDIQSLGIDVEPMEPLKPGLDRYIQSEREINFMRAHPHLPDRLIFSAKESLFKCLYPFVQRFFGFHAVELLIDPELCRFSFIQTGERPLVLPSQSVFHGRFLFEQHHLITACYLTKS